MYSGQFLDGLKHGFGKWKKSKEYNSNTYEGYYNRDKKEGFGIFKWISGNTYIGHYKNDEREGIGQMAWTDGSMYMGEWRAGIQHGYGRMTFPNSKTKEGLFDKNMFKGTAGLESYNIPKELLDRTFDIMSFGREVEFSKEVLRGRTRNVATIDTSARWDRGVYATQSVCARSLLNRSTGGATGGNVTLSENENAEKRKSPDALKQLILERRRRYKKRRVLKSMPKREWIPTGKSTVLGSYAPRGIY